MKKGLNPLYPESDGEGIMGAYEEAALLDNNEKTFRKAKQEGKKIDWESEVKFAEDVRKQRKELDKERKRIMRDYKARLDELRWRKKVGGITRTEFHKQKRKLVKETDAKNWKLFKKYITG